MGVVRAFDDLAREMEKYLSQGAAEYRPGTRFWLEQVRETIALYDSTETPPAGDRHIRKLLAEYDRLRPVVELTEEQKAAAGAEPLRWSSGRS